MVVEERSVAGGTRHIMRHIWPWCSGGVRFMRFHVARFSFPFFSFLFFPLLCI
jgi:hypothetical protein